MKRRRDEHCRSGARPAILAFELHLLGKRYGLPRELLMLVQHHVQQTPAEREGARILSDRRERELAAQRERGAEPPMATFQLLGFRSVEALSMHRVLEAKYREGLRLQKVSASLPEWEAFGFGSLAEMEEHRAQMGM